MKYIEFYRFLENNTKEKLELTYEDIEKIIGKKLHPSAYEHQAYFSNSLSHPISKIWLELGYIWKIFNIRKSKGERSNEYFKTR
ncbi:hypothetical protein I6E31_11070 [Fusobacterium varium]|nr:hypothetical protein [Fusobacterium varium]